MVTKYLLAKGIITIVIPIKPYQSRSHFDARKHARVVGPKTTTQKSGRESGPSRAYVVDCGTNKTQEG